MKITKPRCLQIEIQYSWICPMCDTNYDVKYKADPYKNIDENLKNQYCIACNNYIEIVTEIKEDEK